MTRLVLASGSASRAAMLSAAGVDHDVVPARFDEESLKAADATDMAALALALAEGKAGEVSARTPGRLVLGGDSIAHLEGERYGKPASRTDAERHLGAFSGRALTLTSAAVLVRDGGVRHRIVDSATLQVRDLSDAFIAWYLDREWPAIAACAGCFRIEGLGVHLFDRIEGDHFTILGLPLLPVLAALREEGSIL